MKRSTIISLSFLAVLAIGVMLGRFIPQTWLEFSDKPEDSHARSPLNDHHQNGVITNHRSATRRGSSTHQNKISWRQKIGRLLRIAKGRNESAPYYDRYEFKQLSKQAAESMTSEELQQALEDLFAMNRSKSTPLRGAITSISNILLSQWIKSDPHAVMAHTAKEGAGLHHPARWAMAIQEWASIDPAAASDWLTKNKTSLSSEMNEWSEQITLQALAKRDFEAALETALGTKPERQSELLSLLFYQAAKDPENFEASIDQLLTKSKPEHRLPLAESLIGSLSRTNLDKAIDLAENWQGDGKSKLIDAPAYSWMRKEPEKAINWATKQLEADPRGIDSSDMYQINRLVGTWHQNDPHAAEVWIEQRPNNQSDYIRETLSIKLLHSGQYNKAAASVSKIHNANLRTSNYRDIYTDWIKMEPKGAEKWLASLPEADQTAVRNPVKK